MTKLFTCLALVAICIAMTTGKPSGRRGGRGESRGHHKHDKGHKSLRHVACSVFNVTSGEQVNKACGCEGETVECSWGTLDVTGKFGEDLELKFCDMGDNNTTYPGVLKSACLIKDEDDNEVMSQDCKAPHNETVPDCVMTTSITAVVDGERWTAFFCPPKPDKDDSSNSSAEDDIDDDDIDEDDIDEDDIDEDDIDEDDIDEDDIDEDDIDEDSHQDNENCVRLTKPHKKQKTRKTTKTKHTRNARNNRARI